MSDIINILLIMTLHWYISVICLLSIATLVASHGRLTEPPSRATAWRYGFDTPHNYNDHELYCGGFSRQWHKNGGKCGVCGDAWDQPTPRPHELGGRFGQGVIVKRYSEAEDIDVEVELTANHNGYFQFRVCPDPKDTTQECLDTHLLMRVDEDESRFFPRDGNRKYRMKYHLPDGFTCEHCLFQWIYIAGNNWGDCKNGTGAVGCGPQEEFRACADISIGDQYLTATKRPRPSYVPPSRTPARPSPTPGGTGSGSGAAWLGGCIAAITFICIVAVLAMLYLYYYKGSRIKNWLKPNTAVPQVPVRPPRQKRNSLTRDMVDPYGSDPNGNMEPGFVSVNLRSK